MKYTRRTGATEFLLNGGVLARDFDPATGHLLPGDILGGCAAVQFTAAPEAVDLAAGADGCAADGALWRSSGWRAVLSGELTGLSDGLLALLTGGQPADVWLVADRGVGGALAIRLTGAYPAGGFAVRLADGAAGRLPFRLESRGREPFAVYLTAAAE